MDLYKILKLHCIGLKYQIKNSIQLIVIMKKIISYAFVFLALSSCAVRFKRIVDFEMKIENQNSLETYLNEFGIETEHLYTLKDIFAFKEFHFTGKLNFTDVLFFNSDGYLVKNRFNKGECSQVINEIEQINSAEFEKNTKVDYWLKYIKPIKQSSIETEGEKEYTVIINWAKFIGKYNKQSFEWYNELKNSPSYSKINVIFLNLDIQEDWELSQEDKDALGME